MVSLELKDLEETAQQYADRHYKGNLSEATRELYKKAIIDEQITETKQKKHSNYILLQAVSFTFVGCTLVLLPIYLMFHELIMILFSICVTGGCLLILQVFFLLLNNKKEKGIDKIWN